LTFSRGYFCPKDRRQYANYARDLQPELQVNYCKLITVSVDNPMTTREVRDQLNANWPFLCDPDRKLLHELEMVDTTDPEHGEIYIPYSFILDRDRTIYKIYNGWWFLGRPTVEEIRMDLRALMSRRPDWIYPVDKELQKSFHYEEIA
jgi:peroxiredoxin